MKVVVAGAGPTGAALSYLLARNGIEVVLLERESSFERVFRGEALMPSGVDALRQLGLGDAFDRLSQTVVPTMEIYVDGRRLLRADGDEVAGDNAARAVSQPALLDMLVGAARQAGPCELRMGTALRQFAPRGEGLEVQVESAEGPATLRCDCLVGADGRASLTRARAGIRLQRAPLSMEVAWFAIPAPEAQRSDPKFQSHVRDGRSLVLYPSHDGRIRVGLTFAPGDGRARSGPELLERVARLAGEPYATTLRERSDEIGEPVFFKVLVGSCPEWASGRTLLLGDAAHPMLPVRAQGINLALRDAIVAANHLVPCLRGGGDLAAAMRRIRAEREPEVAAIQQLQLQAMTLPPPMRSPLLRRTVFPVLRRLGVARRMLLRSERPFRHGTVDVRLAV